jgi:hypothetical protein
MLDIFPELEVIELYSESYSCSPYNVSGSLVCQDYSNKSAPDDAAIWYRSV